MENKRNTKQRQIIFSILKEADRPISINEIYDQVIRKLPNVAKSTIYRNIDSLLEQNLIDKYYFEDKEVSYKIKESKNEHKHFVICDDCKKVFDLPLCPIQEIQNAMDKEGFTVQNHQIQISGICKNCSNVKIRKNRDKS